MDEAVHEMKFGHNLASNTGAPYFEERYFYSHRFARQKIFIEKKT